MTVRFKNAFFKDLERLPKGPKTKIENLVFVAIPSAKDLSQISNVKKLKGYERFYRIRIGDFRLGFEKRDNAIIFHRVLHRSNIYRYFP